MTAREERLLERFTRRAPDVKDTALLLDLLQDAGQMLCAYTGRAELPELLEAAQIDAAAMLLNRLGMEGESAHTEGSVARSAESLPEWLRRQLNPYRVARTVSPCG